MTDKKELDPVPESIVSSDIPKTLEGLADAINKEHLACEQAMHSTMEHAWRAGELLILAKADVPHGEWNAWVKENFAGSMRTAQGYMRVYRERDSLGNAQRVAHLSLRGALKELAEPQPQKLERIKIKPPEYIETLRNNRKRAPADAAGDTTVETVTFKTAGVSGRASEAPEPQTEPVGALEDESGSAIDPEESRILPIRKWWHLQGAVRSLATTDLDPEKLAQAWFEDVEGNEEDRYLICEQVYKANETLNLIAAAMEVLEKKSRNGE